MTNKEFKELSPEEVVAYFESLTEEQVESLSKDQRAAYDAWKNPASTDVAETPVSQELAGFFDSLTELQVASLSKEQRAMFERHRATKAAADPAPTTVEEVVANFRKHNKGLYPNDHFYVTSDLNVFHGTPKGYNSLLNHLNVNKALGVTGQKYTFNNED